jgi:hypothetical protein
MLAPADWYQLATIGENCGYWCSHSNNNDNSSRITPKQTNKQTNSLRIGSALLPGLAIPTAALDVDFSAQ